MDQEIVDREEELDQLERERRRFQTWGRGLGMLPSAALLGLAGWAFEEGLVPLAFAMAAMSAPAFIAGSAVARCLLYPRAMPKVPIDGITAAILVAATGVGLAVAWFGGSALAFPGSPPLVGPLLVAAAAASLVPLGLALGAFWNTALFPLITFAMMLWPVLRPAKTENASSAMLGLAAGLAVVALFEHRRAWKLERRLAALDVAPATTEASGVRAPGDPLGKLGAATRVYAKCASGRANGLRSLPAALLFICGAAGNAISPGLGMVLVALAPLAYLVSLRMAHDSYSPLGLVVEDPDYPEPTPRAQWAIGIVSLVLSVAILVGLWQPLQEVAPVGRFAYLALFSSSLVLTPLLAWRWRLPAWNFMSASAYVGMAAMTAGIHRRFSGFGWPLALAGLLLLAISLWEHLRFRRALGVLSQGGHSA